MVPPRGPGITYVIPLVERMVRVDLRTVTLDVPPQDVITRDNVSVKVSAVLYFRVMDPTRAIREVVNYLFATSQLAQVELRSVCGQAELDELLSQREKLNSRIQEILDSETEPWGVKVVLVELKHIDLPQEMQRAMAKQAEAERERRAKIIHAEGEYQASAKLAEAAEIIAKQPNAMHLRFLQSLVQVAAENNHTVVIPIPVDVMTLLLDKMKESSSGSHPDSAQPPKKVIES
jgi:regulator of protease activity HflC (stomatin/prohibitin superfamily)